jgi:tRNA U34 5-carboxymethylaminomethyl modifying GTPase MnmE/TrmE
MKAKDVLSLNQRLHDWMHAYDQELGKDLAHYLKKHAISRPEELERTFAQLCEDGRLLQIGVVGRVKAGKSSLLNALVFGGQNVLPRAATPMTAALTTLTYAKSFSAQVNFYNEADLKDIELSAQRFETRFNDERTRAAEQLRRRRPQGSHVVEDEAFHTSVEQVARREMQRDASLCAAHDQWLRIQQCGVDLRSLSAGRDLNALDTTELARQLLDYVGAEGCFMPLTKSVDILLPLDTLRDLRIVDTPGINDPVQSREQRTSALLKDCDVVFIVSPAGQFLSEQDLEVMSRITQKEGVQELVLVASQIDNQLYGSDTCLPTLQASVEKVTNDLNEHMVETLQRLKQYRPEIGSLFDRLLQQGSGQVLYTSGLCHNLSVRWNEQNTWDASERKAWENLHSHYPDFFTQAHAERARANLDLLANTAAMRSVLECVRARKDALIEQRRVDLVRTKASALQAFRGDLVVFIEQAAQEIKNADLDHLKAQRRELDDQVTVGTFVLDNAVEQCVSEFRDQIEQRLLKELKHHYDGTQHAFATNTTDKIERSTRTRDSLVARFANWTWGGGQEEHSFRIFRLFWHPVRAALLDFAEAMGSELRKTSDDLVRQFRSDLIKDITSVSRVHLEQASGGLIIKSVQGLVAKLQIPTFELDTRDLEQLHGTTDTLHDAEARAFLEQATTKLHHLEHQTKRKIRKMKDEIHEHIPRSFGENFFKDMHARIHELQESVDNALLSLDRLRRMAKALEAV